LAFGVQIITGGKKKERSGWIHEAEILASLILSSNHQAKHVLFSFIFNFISCAR